MTPRLLLPLVALLLASPARGVETALTRHWLWTTAYHVPDEYTTEQSGYFSIVEGHNGRLYVGAAKYGVNAYLLEFDPKGGTTRMVLDVHAVAGSSATGFAAQAKLHTRNNVGAAKPFAVLPTSLWTSMTIRTFSAFGSNSSR